MSPAYRIEPIQDDGSEYGILDEQLNELAVVYGGIKVARLFAAAPEMLSALQEAATELWSLPASSNAVLNKVRAAIANAEGRS